LKNRRELVVITDLKRKKICFLKKEIFHRCTFLRAFGSTFSFFSRPNRKKVIPVLVVYEFLNFKKGESLPAQES
jgi:hypothetical protein